MRKHGFTLIEIIVMVGVIAIVSTVMSQGLLMLFRTQYQSGQSSDTKQNGDQALAVMERLLRAAQTVTTICDGSDQKSVSFTDQNENEATFSCMFDGTTTYIASESANGISRLTANSVTLGSDCISADIAFTCTRSSNGSQAVGIGFTLRKVGSSPESYLEPTSTSFRTTISIRNE